MVKLDDDTELARLKSALTIVYNSCQKVIEQAEEEKDQYYQIPEKRFLKLKGNLQFLKSEFEEIGSNQE